MFICGFCKEPSKPREKCTMIVVETRRKFYQKGGMTVGRGIETVQEKKACTECAKEHEGEK